MFSHFYLLEEDYRDARFGMVLWRGADDTSLVPGVSAAVVLLPLANIPQKVLPRTIYHLAVSPPGLSPVPAVISL